MVIEIVGAGKGMKTAGVEARVSRGLSVRACAEGKDLYLNG